MAQKENKHKKIFKCNYPSSIQTASMWKEQLKHMLAFSLAFHNLNMRDLLQVSFC